MATKKSAGRKNPAAVALGRLGGQAKGVAKGFAAMTEEERKAVSAKANKARWGKASKRKTKG